MIKLSGLIAPVGDLTQMIHLWHLFFLLVPVLSLRFFPLSPARIFQISLRDEPIQHLLHGMHIGPSLESLLANMSFPFQALYNDACYALLDEDHFEVIIEYDLESTRSVMLHAECMRSSRVAIHAPDLWFIPSSLLKSRGMLPSNISKRAFLSLLERALEDQRLPQTHCQWLFAIDLGLARESFGRMDNFWQFLQPAVP